MLIQYTGCTYFNGNIIQAKSWKKMLMENCIAIMKMYDYK